MYITFTTVDMVKERILYTVIKHQLGRCIIISKKQAIEEKRKQAEENNEFENSHSKSKKR